MEREGGNGERMRKCIESISLHFLILSSFPLYFLILSPFPLRFLFISSFSLHFLAARLQGCNDSCSPGLGVYSENSKSIENLAVVMQHYISARELWFFGTTKCPGLPSVHSMTMTKKTQNVQNDKNQDNAVTMIPYDLEEVQDDDDDFILRLSHAPRPAHISGDPLSGQTTLILVIIIGCTLPTTWLLL